MSQQKPRNLQPLEEEGTVSLQIVEVMYKAKHMHYVIHQLLVVN